MYNLNLKLEFKIETLFILKKKFLDTSENIYFFRNIKKNYS